MNARGLVIGAPRSGAGKTTVTIGLLRALRRRGLRVRGLKSGPDYIDPAFHAAASGAPGGNLDSWAMPPDLMDALAREATARADVVVVESAMGLFDGVPSAMGRSGAAADLARRYGLSVALVLDVSGQSQSAAAVARGFAAHDEGVRIAGVILNQVASERHRRLVVDAISAIGLTVFGVLPRNATIALPERHLGLVQAREHSQLDQSIDRLADFVEQNIDLDALLTMAAPFAPAAGDARSAPPPPGQRIAVADDAAFSFLYPHIARHWRNMGAELVPFSPLADEAPDASCDVCWLPGGYPELNAGRLAAAAKFRAGMLSFAARKPIHGECGGYMVLGAAIEDAAGLRHEMLGLLGQVTSFAKRKLSLGYRTARLLADCPIGARGAAVRGHEFHYAQTIDAGDDENLAEVSDAGGDSLGFAGSRRGLVSGSFFHVIAGA